MVHLGPNAPKSRKGTFTNVNPEYLAELKEIEKLLIVSKETLKKITDRFVLELKKGLEVKNSTVPMIPTWVLQTPTGEETGEFLAIDLGGTNLRIVLVKFEGNRSFDITQSKFPIPKGMRNQKSEVLWDFVADSLKKFMENDCDRQITETMPLGFTFSYPATQNYITEGVLQNWTKGWNISDVEGKDVVPMLASAFKKYKLPIEIVALVNDTTGTLVASMFSNSFTKVGMIFGTGCNGAYYEKVANIPKLLKSLPKGICEETMLAINCEYGAFDSDHVILPRTKYDIQIDNESPKPNKQAYEKMISGYYLGEILRVIMIDFVEKLNFFKNQDLKKLRTPYILDTAFLANIESDPFENLSEVEDLFNMVLDIQTTIPERKIIRRLAELIGERSARLAVCGIAAICKKCNYEYANCAADGSVYRKYPHFKERAAMALREIFEWDTLDDKIKIVPAEDGSGVGAAIIASLTMARMNSSLPVGMIY